jgi:hypothetical protein
LNSYGLNALCNAWSNTYAKKKNLLYSAGYLIFSGSEGKIGKAFPQQRQASTAAIP